MAAKDINCYCTPVNAVTNTNASKFWELVPIGTKFLKLFQSSPHIACKFQFFFQKRSSTAAILCCFKHNVHYETYVLQKYELSRVPKSANLFSKWYNYIQYGKMTNQVTNPKSWTRSTATTSKNFVQAPSIIAKGSKYELIIDFDKARLAMIGIGSAKKY